MTSTNTGVTKTLRARELGVSRGMLYYRHKLPERDWKLKCAIECVLRKHPSYGSPRISLVLRRNHKPIERVMKTFGIKAYRRRGKKYRKQRRVPVQYQNLLLHTMPLFRGHVWAADFTEIWWRDKKMYVATVIDLYTREIVGMSVSMHKGVQLTAAALWNALLANSRPVIFHSDNGSEYRARSFAGILSCIGTAISRTHPGCPWENGYQESFYDKFKIDLGDPSRCTSFGELLVEVYSTIWTYNHTRIHSALKMPPAVFALQVEMRNNQQHKISV